MSDHIFAYLGILFFVFLGLWALLHDIPALLLYHKKVQARGKPGERYIQRQIVMAENAINTAIKRDKKTFLFFMA